VRTFPYTVRTDDTPKVRFSATVGEQPEVEVSWSSDCALVSCLPNRVHEAFSKVRSQTVPGSSCVSR
jgi:hypothetical protein